MYVFDTLADWEPGFAIAGLNNPDLQMGPEPYRVRTVGLTSSPVRSIGGVTMVPDLELDALSPADSAMLILPGGEAWDAGGNEEAAEKAGEFLNAGVPVAAICGATAGLARAGLLDTRRHTSNAPEYLVATGYAGAALYEDRAVVADRGLITASAMAALDFARAIFVTLDVYPPDVLEAWYGLFSTRRPEYFEALIRAAAAQSAGQEAGSPESS
jgi:putative intracellular protease/amidase